MRGDSDERKGEEERGEEEYYVNDMDKCVGR